MLSIDLLKGASVHRIFQAFFYQLLQIRQEKKVLEDLASIITNYVEKTQLPSSSVKSICIDHPIVDVDEGCAESNFPSVP